MSRVGRFEKVSFLQFEEDMNNFFKYKHFTASELQQMYSRIDIPTRGTKYSCGYDFICPIDINVSDFDEQKRWRLVDSNASDNWAANRIMVPTGIRWISNLGTDPLWKLALYPRSGKGTKDGIILSNTVGIVDADYFMANNEGHIMAAIAPGCMSKLNYKIQAYLDTHTDEPVLKAGEKFIQGIFEPVGLAEEPFLNEIQRTGGFGSTGSTSGS